MKSGNGGVRRAKISRQLRWRNYLLAALAAAVALAQPGRLALPDRRGHLVAQPERRDQRVRLVRQARLVQQDRRDQPAPQDQPA